MKKLIFTLMLSFVFIGASAQQWGFTVGKNFSTFTNPDDLPLEYKAGGGLAASFVWYIGINDNLDYMMGLSYMQHGFTETQQGTVGGDYGYDQNGEYNYIPSQTGEIATDVNMGSFSFDLVGLRYRFTDDWHDIRPYAQAVLGIGFLWGDYTMTVDSEYFGSGSGYDMGLTDFNVTYELGLGVEYKRNIIIGLNHRKGLVNAFEGANGKCSDIILSIGYLF